MAAVNQGVRSGTGPATPDKSRFMRTVAARAVLQPPPGLLAGLRIVPAAMLFIGVAVTAPAVGATGCSSPNVAVSGGTVQNSTTVDLSADGGVAVSDAQGGDNNIA